MFYTNFLPQKFIEETKADTPLGAGLIAAQASLKWHVLARGLAATLGGDHMAASGRGRILGGSG